MKLMGSHFRWFAVFVLLAASFGPGLHAGPSQDELLQRMERNLPAVMALKMSGKVGENNRALLQPRAALAPEERALVNAQNEDRIALYTLLAQRIESSVAAVQVKRAEDIRDRSPSGVWLQSEKGEWYRKQ